MEGTRAGEWLCFECGDPLMRSEDGSDWRCEAGHRYPADMMLEDGGEILERVLRATMIALEGGSEIVPDLQAPIRHHIERIQMTLRQKYPPSSNLLYFQARRSL